jgi:hypothetical protein
LHWTLVQGAEGTDSSKLISVIFMSYDQIFYRIPADRIEARHSTPSKKTKKLNFFIPPLICPIVLATVNQHPPVHHHQLDAHYYSVVDESQLSQYLVSPW